MSDVAIPAIPGNPVNHGFAGVATNGQGTNYQIVVPTHSGIGPSASGYNAHVLDNRFDDPRYYTGDSA